MPKNLLKRKPKYKRELSRAKKLISKLFSIKAVKVILILLLIFLFAPFVLFFLLKPTPAENITYGVTFSNKYATEIGLDWKDTYTKILDDLGVKNMRLVAYWSDIEAENDKYNFEDIRWQLQEAEKRNVNIILAIGKKVPRYPECFEPEWWKKIEDEQARELELLEYIKEITNKFKNYDCIKTWQVENEPFWPFGECTQTKKSTIEKEISLVRHLDDRPVLVQDSGEGGFWFPSYSMADLLGISMYRRIWYDFWGVFFGNFIYFKYPLAHWSYKIRANITRVPVENIIVTELQAEPWGPVINSQLTQEEKDKTMSRADFLDTINYAQKTGFDKLYLWGVEWWYWEKEVNNNPFFWIAAKALFN